MKNECELAEKVDLLHIISSRNQVDYNMKYDRKVLNNIAESLLTIAVSTYSAIDDEVL